MYQSTVHIPAVVFGAGRIPAEHSVSDNVALFDFGPTILEWAGVEVPQWMEANSLVPYFEDKAMQGRNRVFAEHSNDALLTGTRFMTMIQTRDRLIDEILNWRLESSMKTQGFIDACMRESHAMMSPPGSPARGQHREGSR